MLCPLVMRAEDWSKLGFKGKVMSAQVYRVFKNPYKENELYENYQFTSQGRLVTFMPFVNCGFGSDFTVSPSKITDGLFTATLQAGKIRSIKALLNNGQTMNLIYTYGENNQLHKVDGEISWQTTTVKHISASSQMNEAVTKAKKLKAELDKLKPGTAAYNKKMAEYQAAAKEATVNNVSGKNVTETKNHSEKFGGLIYSNYKFDVFGNWTEREVLDGGELDREYQKIVYEPEFLSSYNWGIVENNDNLDSVEVFFMDTLNNTKNYRDKAYKYWNANILKVLEEKYNNASDKMIHAASSEICSDENREKLLVIAREQIFQQNVLTERDYVKLRAISELSDRDLKVFNTEYQTKILARAQKMYEDSIAYLQDKITKELANKQFEEAQATSLHALTIDSTNSTFLKQRADAEYQLLMEKKDNKIVTAADYKQFRVDNPNSFYDAEVADLYDRQYTRENRGSFYHIGIAGDISFGKGMFESSGGLGIRLGWHCSIINFYAGIQYGGFGVISNSESSDSDEDTRNNGGHFTGQHITIPLMLRLNFARNLTDNWYVGLGANFNVVTQAYLGYVDEDNNVHHYKDKNLYYKSTFITPRIAFGYSGSFIELEVFGLYELADVLNENMINSYINNNPNYKFNMDCINKQYGYKFSGGVALRFMF